MKNSNRKMEDFVAFAAISLAALYIPTMVIIFYFKYIK